MKICEIQKRLLEILKLNPAQFLSCIPITKNKLHQSVFIFILDNKENLFYFVSLQETNLRLLLLNDNSHPSSRRLFW